MDVIIVSKTHMSNAACVGGIFVNGRFVRLLDSNGYNQDSETKLEVGDVYTITFSERTEKRLPHVEDILVHSLKHKFTFSSIDKMIEYLTDKLKVKIWRGSTEALFDSHLQWTSGGSGFISESSKTPDSSVGFWIPDKDLNRKDYDGKVKYSYPIRWRNIPFVGFQKPIDRIPKGTLVRVSLARWWTPNEDEERCYLQLSGWYQLPEDEAADGDEEKEDFPF
tara:strand:- start:64 stop:729 length:666 start_codon:yes stop_codon:yes gene_type:complete